jgi:hypothetical protein
MGAGIAELGLLVKARPPSSKETAGFPIGREETACVAGVELDSAAAESA